MCSKQEHKLMANYYHTACGQLKNLTHGQKGCRRNNQAIEYEVWQRNPTHKNMRKSIGISWHDTRLLNKRQRKYINV